jgi:hypothetical protein
MRLRHARRKRSGSERPYSKNQCGAFAQGAAGSQEVQARLVLAAQKLRIDAEALLAEQEEGAFVGDVRIALPAHMKRLETPSWRAMSCISLAAWTVRSMAPASSSGLFASPIRRVFATYSLMGDKSPFSFLRATSICTASGPISIEAKVFSRGI